MYYYLRLVWNCRTLNQKHTGSTVLVLDSFPQNSSTLCRRKPISFNRNYKFIGEVCFFFYFGIRGFISHTQDTQFTELDIYW